MEYYKINSLWKRHGWYFEENVKLSPELSEKRQSFIVGDYACSEFGNIKKWRVDEKIDGTNVRIVWNQDKNQNVIFKGRTENANMPCHLLGRLQQIFTSSLLAERFPQRSDGSFPHIILFGEGYGPKIQACGGNYGKEPNFMLFDIIIDGWILERDRIKTIAEELNLQLVPDLGIMSEQEIVEFVKSKPLSRCSETPQMMEGVVCRPAPLMLFRNGNPIMFKLKCREFIDREYKQKDTT